mmetsp:Transcript_40531/g.126164  ORF Transcript_40531/g.126164 Transcript_40531/m.126164 type:complete len:449 (-) Transcript_40531:344-1690(-)
MPKAQSPYFHTRGLSPECGCTSSREPRLSRLTRATAQGRERPCGPRNRLQRSCPLRSLPRGLPLHQNLAHLRRREAHLFPVDARRLLPVHQPEDLLAGSLWPRRFESLLLPRNLPPKPEKGRGGKDGNVAIPQQEWEENLLNAVYHSPPCLLADLSHHGYAWQRLVEHAHHDPVGQAGVGEADPVLQLLQVHPSRFGQPGHMLVPHLPQADEVHPGQEGIFTCDHAKDAHDNCDLEAALEEESTGGLCLRLVERDQPCLPVVQVLGALHPVPHGPFSGHRRRRWWLLLLDRQSCCEAEVRQAPSDPIQEVLFFVPDEGRNNALQEADYGANNCVDIGHDGRDEEAEELLEDKGPEQLRHDEEPRIRRREDASDPRVREEPPVGVLKVAVLRETCLAVEEEVGVKIGKPSPPAAERRAVAVPVEVLGRDAWSGREEGARCDEAEVQDDR